MASFLLHVVTLTSRRFTCNCVYVWQFCSCTCPSVIPEKAPSCPSCRVRIGFQWITIILHDYLNARQTCFPDVCMMCWIFTEGLSWINLWVLALGFVHVLNVLQEKTLSKTSKQTSKHKDISKSCVVNFLYCSRRLWRHVQELVGSLVFCRQVFLGLQTQTFAQGRPSPKNYDKVSTQS